MTTIDLNADVGEMHADIDTLMVAVVSSVSIACGGHAGDDASMRRVATEAAAAGVRIGAHPSYEDRAGFGRTRLDVPTRQLAASIVRQVLRLADNSPARVEYVKPHGALYHAAASDPDVAAALLTAVTGLAADLGHDLALMGQPGSAYVLAARTAGLPTILEGFADRAYTPEGRLVPRDRAGAVLTDHSAVVDQVVGLARGEVRCTGGQVVSVRAESVCVHSDTPGAAALAGTIRNHLTAAGITVRARP